MIFDHDVKHDGKWYPMGTDVPVGKAAEKPVIVEENAAEPVAAEAAEEPKKPVQRGRKKKV